MAVARMTRVELIGYRPVLDDVVASLQRAELLQVDAPPEGLATESLPADDERRRSVEEYAADARFVRDFLAPHHTPSQPLSAFISEKIHLSVEDFESIDVRGVLAPLYAEVERIAETLGAVGRERERLAGLARDLGPWLGVRLQIGQWMGTEHVALFTGTVPANEGERIREHLREVTPLASVAEYGGSGARQAWIVLAHRSEVDAVRAALASTGFAEVVFPDLTDYPAEEHARVVERIAAIDEEVRRLKDEAAALAASRYADAVTVVEYLDSAAAAVHVLEHVGHTERTFVVRGWARESRRAELDEVLAGRADRIDVTYREPAEDETPPVELENPRWLRPFEVLTDLYGRPSYGDLDPTPLLAPFFLTFFAICVGDVGYGAMLAGAAWVIKTRLDVTVGVKRFMDLLIYGGAAAMVVGVLFGSWFAIPVDSLPAPLRAAQVLDPLAQLQTFLVLTIALGVVQVFFGVGVAAYDAFRRGDAASAVFEQLSTIFMFVMIAVAAVTWSGSPSIGRAALVVGLAGTMLMQGRTLEASLRATDRPTWDRALGWVWLATVLVWIGVLAIGGPALAGWTLAGVTVAGLAVSVTVRRSVVSFLGGAYAVYGMSSFIGDILSYTRLAALGLSGTLVGMVFNLLAGLVWSPVTTQWGNGGLGWVWAPLIAVLAALVFLVGHVFNVVINLLGAFVHPARLQFVEFFSKFYEGGGRPLAPFGHVTRSVVLNAGPVRQEGGAGS